MELYKAILDDKHLYKKYLYAYHQDVKTAPRSLSLEECKKIGYLYTRLVEDKVINAIKHMEGGSSAFEIYFLENITKNNQNAEKVANSLMAEPFGMDGKLISSFMDIVRWANTSGVTLAIKNFISSYNKGATKPASVFDDIIQEYTYVGKLVEPLVECVKVINNSIISGSAYPMNYKFHTWPEVAVEGSVQSELDLELEAFAKMMAA